MSFGALSSLTAIYLLGRHNPTIEAAKDSVFIAAIVGSLTALAGLSAIFYPGTDWMDPEFHTGAKIGFQACIFIGHLGIIWIAYSREKARLEKLRKSE